MKIIAPSHEILFMPDGETVLKNIELAGRTCYKSHDKITPDSAAAFVKRILKSGHHSVIEHMAITVRFICDRGIMAELTRHRLASFSVESTRYANYAKDKFGNEITVIQPPFWEEGSPAYERWKAAMERAEADYLALIRMGATAQEARSVLPNSLKTEIVTTANLREWRHIFSLRCDKAAHPQMREIMRPLLAEFHQRIPVVFADLHEQFLLE